MASTEPGRVEERILVFAPEAGEADRYAKLLAEVGLAPCSCADLQTLCTELEVGAGALLISDAALAGDADPASACLVAALGRQPEWSDVPIVLLARQGAESPPAARALDLFGNVVVEEPPFSARTLVSVLGVALRARRRQYQLRDRLEALQASEQRFARFMAHLPGLTWIKDREGRYVYANDAAERAFQVRRADLYGKTDAEIFPPETAREFSGNDRSVLDGERVVELFEHLRHDDGVVHESIVRKFPIPDADGSISLIGGVAIDITERRRIEEALRESEERFRFLAETIPSIVWTAAPDGAITYVNRRWLDYCGITEQENVHGWPELVLHPDDRERCIAQWSKALRDGETYEIEVRNRRHDGVYRWFVTRAEPRRDAAGRIVSWFGITTDIHDQKLLHEALREADRRKDEFLATLAHELRNPLAPIRNVLGILRLSGGALNEEMRQLMERQLALLVRLVDDLLELARITSGKIELRKERVDLAAVLRSAIETSLPAIEAGGHQLTLDLPQDPVPLDADPIRLAQVVSNLLNNAARYTPAGGHIWLASRREGGAAVVSVRDTGAGIAAEMLPHVFELFVQAPPGTGQAPEGLGIGLTLARDLVEKHGGSIAARSDGPGRGSEFVVTVPLADEPRVPRAAPRGDDRPPAAAIRCTVLAVDDNRDAADSLAILLELLGAEVRVAYDGVSALRSIEAYRPQVAILDVGLPDIDGNEVARRVRAEPSLRHTALVAMTGWGQEEDRRRCLAAGFDHHLVKPADIQALQRLLRAISSPAGAPD